MFKIILTLKKRPDLSREQFIDYYDNKHVPFMHGLLETGAAIHRRNFVIPEESPQVNVGGNDNPNSHLDFDVITEVFYEDRETADRVVKALSSPEIRKLTQEDENNFVLPGSIRKYVVEAHETVFRPLAST